MSLSFVPYLVKIEEIRAARAGSDKALLGSIRNANPKAFKGTMGVIGEAVQEILAGSPLDVERTMYYGDALELICRQLGKPVEAGLFQEVSALTLMEVGLVQPLLDAGPPIDLPEPPEGYSVVGHLRLDQIRTLLDGWTDDILDHQAQEIRAARYEFSEWLEAARDQSLDLVAFCR